MMMTSLKIFFRAYKYLTECVENSIKILNRDTLRRMFEILIEARDNERTIIVDGQGRSLQSALILEDCLEHNNFPIILPASNANVRPWRKGDVFIFNSGSGSGSPLRHAQVALEDGLHVLGMTYNAKIHEKFKKEVDGILILTPSENKNPLYAPLGTEFEFTTAVIGAAMGYSVCKTPEESLEAFTQATSIFIDNFKRTYDYFEENLDALIDFIRLISKYIEPNNKHYVYFRGVGRNTIINQVAAIRYGHLHKVDEHGNVVKDLRVIYDGHWDLRKEGDLAICTSGSGSTSQTLNYATQAFISGMRVFGITSFENSELGRFTKRVDGCLVVPGRKDPFSMYNIESDLRKPALPEFELNVYITMDALLAQIAHDHGITEADMRASHRSKALE